jgi:hypothetical protein
MASYRAVAGAVPWVDTDPRGPFRRVAAVVWDDGGHRTITLDCGHTPGIVSHMAVKVGEDCRCYACGKERLANAAAEGV